MVKQNNKAVEAIKLFVVIALVAAGIWAYGGVKNLPPYANIAFPVISSIAAVLIFLFWCNMGRSLIGYIGESYTEFKKVVWPKRTDAVRMTIFVVIFSALFAVFIYGVDSIISLLFNIILVKR